MSVYKARRVRAGEYEVVSGDGTVAASIVLTGRYGADNYPWEWFITDPRMHGRRRSAGTTDTKREALDKIRFLLAECDADNNPTQPGWTGSASHAISVQEDQR